MSYPVGLVDWLARGERGISSEAIVTHCLGVDCTKRHVWWSNHPLDPADLRRCLLLLDTVPEARAELHRIASVSRAWRSLYENWDELESLLREEIGEDLPFRNWSAPRTYSRMRELLDASREESAT